MIEHVLSKLKGVVKAGTGYKARCPAHDDRVPSLSITVTENGKILVHCHAGCSQSAVMDFLGIGIDQLRPVSRPRIVATYNYRDENGEELFQSVRFEPKGFRQRVLEPNGPRWNLNGTRRVLYRLPELIRADTNLPVFIVEGEKDVDRLIDAGLIAVCNPGGAGKWRDEYSSFLHGRNCVVVPDNDEAGLRHADLVAKSLTEKAASVRILELDGLPSKGDVSDYLDAGNSVEEMLRAAKAIPVYQAPSTPEVRQEQSESKQSAPESESKKEGTQSSRLMKLVEGISLFHTSDREAFATVPVESHHETYSIKSRAFRSKLPRYARFVTHLGHKLIFSLGSRRIRFQN